MVHFAVHPPRRTQTHNKTSMGYDPIGRLEWVVAPKGNLAGADQQLWKTVLVSDEFGRGIEETDPLGNPSLSD